MFPAVITAKRTTPVFRFCHDDDFAAFPTGKFPMNGFGTYMFRMFPVQFFAMLRAKFSTTISRLRNAHSLAALQARKFPYGRRIGRPFYPIIIDGMVICIPSTGIAAVSLGNAGRCKLFTTNSTFHTGISCSCRSIRRPACIQARKKGQYILTLSCTISIWNKAHEALRLFVYLYKSII